MKEKFVFFLIFLAIVIPWKSVMTDAKEYFNRPLKPLMPKELANAKIDEAGAILDAARDKGDSYTAEDYFRDLYKLAAIEDEFLKYRNPSIFYFTRNLNSEKYKWLIRKIARDGGDPSTVISNAHNVVCAELNIKHNVEKVSPEEMRKFLKGIRNMWLVGLVLSILLLIYRCFIKSNRQTVKVNPVESALAVALWPLGMIILGYPENSLSSALRYHRLRRKYMQETRSRFLYKCEENVLWKQATSGKDEQTGSSLGYSKSLAVLSTLIIWMISPIGNMRVLAQSVKEKVEITRTVEDEEKVEFSGFLQFEYKKSEGNETFSIPTAVICIDGKISENLNWKLEADAARMELRDVFFYYAIDDWIRVKAGKWFAFFTAAPSPNEWYLVEYPEVIDLATIYEVGVLIDGDIGPIKYYLGVLNGNDGELADDNREKDVYANLALQPIGGFSIGAKYQAGEQLDGMRKRFGAHMEFEVPELKLNFLSEYMRQEIPGDVKSGWYVTGVWKPLESVQFVSQYEFFKEPGRGKKVLTLGLNYLFKNLKLQLNYAFSNMGNQLLAKAQVSF